jgi:hypothetical protein
VKMSPHGSEPLVTTEKEPEPTILSRSGSVIQISRCRFVPLTRRPLHKGHDTHTRSPTLPEHRSVEHLLPMISAGRSTLSNLPNQPDNLASFDRPSNTVMFSALVRRSAPNTFHISCQVICVRVICVREKGKGVDSFEEWS